MLEIIQHIFSFLIDTIIIMSAILLTFLGIVTIAAHKHIFKNKITVISLTKHYKETKKNLLKQTLPKKSFSKWLKSAKKSNPEENNTKKIYVLTFQGDIKASSVTTLREEITALLSIAQPKDEIILRLESAGGAVHAYGLAASQLMRIRQEGIPLTICIDKIAASGGYMIASTANQIIAAPFAIVGSIGVVAQLPNFHRLLKDKHIDFEQITSGKYKRTLSLFGENTDPAREKFRQDIEDIHQQFKTFVNQNRPVLDIEKISTGEYWLANRALDLKLVDKLQTSDDYLYQASQHSVIYEIKIERKKTFLEKLGSNIKSML